MSTSQKHQIHQVIAYYGKGNVGKTHTLNQVINDLAKDDRFKLISAYSNGVEKQSTLEQIIQWPLNQDRRICFSYGSPEKIICITTSGDNEDCIEDNYRFSLEHKAYILVTASRTKGATTEALQNRFEKEKNSLSPIWWISAASGLNSAIHKKANTTMTKAIILSIEAELGLTPL